MLITGHHLLDVANANSFAVPAFNVSDWAMTKGIFEIAEEKQSPVIIAIHPIEVAHAGYDFLAAVIRRAHRASVPVTIHLDHGPDVEQALLAIQAGYTSVMIDASMHPFEKNVEITTGVAEVAHAVGLSVEGELGTIGKLDEQAEEGVAVTDITYTDPAEAAEFVRRTGVDSLAVAIGTAHGLYPKHVTPELKLDLLQEIKAAVPGPLVLHGGSGNPDDEIARAVKLGVCKINIASDVKSAYYDTMRKVLQDGTLREPAFIEPECVKAMQAVCAHKIDLFDAAGRASLY